MVGSRGVATGGALPGAMRAFVGHIEVAHVVTVHVSNDEVDKHPPWLLQIPSRTSAGLGGRPVPLFAAQTSGQGVPIARGMTVQSPVVASQAGSVTQGVNGATVAPVPTNMLFAYVHISSKAMFGIHVPSTPEQLAGVL